jgi:prepilin-type N-terminal cleavage/methylation domain-containing protein
MRTVRAGRPADAGLTLIEVVVSVAIMSVFLAMVTGAMLRLFQTSNAVTTTSAAHGQLNTAFMRLDKQIRYAAGISTPAAVGGDQYVEWVTTNTGTAICTELRLHVSNNQLQQRTWTDGTSPVTPTAWLPLASDVTGSTPFTFSAADATSNFQRLELKLTATPAGLKTGKQLDVLFTAMNTSLATSSATRCTEGRSVP